MTDSPDSQGVVLVAEPSLMFRECAGKVCDRHDIRSVFAENAAQAFDIICNQHLVGVVTAFELPGLPGSSLIAALKDSPAHRSIPVALMSSNDDVENHLGAYHPDAIIQKNDHFTENLTRFFSSLAGIKTARQDPAAPGTEHAERGLDAKILLVEDSASLQKLASRFLHRAGASVTVADDGRQAITLAAKATFDLIFMDIEMPIMNGFEATAKLRKMGIQIPIIALTAHDSEEIKTDLLQGGFTDRLSKPFDQQQLIETCEAYLESVT